MKSTDPQSLKYQNVTISGLPGAGSSTLGKLVANQLGWEYFSGGDFMRSYAIENGLFDSNTTTHHDATVYSEEFDRQVDHGMRQTLSSQSGKVMDSWLSGFVAQGVKGVLKVMVYCSEDDIRVDRIVNRDSISIVEAKKHIFEREEKNVTKWRRMYHKEWQQWVVDQKVLPKYAEIDFYNPKLYDLTIDTYSHSREQTLELVIKRLKNHDSKSSR